MIGVAVVGLLFADRDDAGPALSTPAGAPVDEPGGGPSPTTPAASGAAVVGVDAAVTDSSSPDPAVDQPPAKPGSFTIAASGDILPHRSLLLTVQQRTGELDIDGSFEEVRPLISAADLAICHVEGALMFEGEQLRPSQILGTPPVWLREIKRAGYDRCSTASNHSLDGGMRGVDATVDNFAKYGLDQSGVAKSAETVLPEVVEINGIGVAHLSYTFGFDHGRLPANEPWRANLIKPERIIADAKAMRKKGAEVVILSLHFGGSQWPKPSPYQLRVADAVTRSGQIDLIIGAHSHVVQPIEKVNGVWVAWGMGDFLSNHPVNKSWGPATQDGIIVTATIRRNAKGAIVVERPVAHPTWCDKRHSYTVRLAAPGERSAGLPEATVTALDASFARTKRAVGDFLAQPAA